MKTIPILFSTPMVIALEEKRKNQTRRTRGLEYINQIPGDWKYEGYRKHKTIGKPGSDMVHYFTTEYGEAQLLKCPYGEVGDVLWVRETWLKCQDGYIYRAHHFGGNILTSENGKTFDETAKWKPSIFMPREACRRFLEVTNVRAERLQDISEEDAINEGIEIDVWDQCPIFKDYENKGNWFHDWSSEIKGYSKFPAKDSYKSLWDKINKKKITWDKNPWLWRIQIKEVDKPEIF